MNSLSVLTKNVLNSKVYYAINMLVLVFYYIVYKIFDTILCCFNEVVIY